MRVTISIGLSSEESVKVTDHDAPLLEIIAPDGTRIPLTVRQGATCIELRDNISELDLRATKETPRPEPEPGAEKKPAPKKKKWF